MRLHFQRFVSIGAIFYVLCYVQIISARQLRTLPENVLEMCFEQLDLETLINVVDSDDVGLLGAANWAFCVKYGEKMFEIQLIFDEYSNESIIEPPPLPQFTNEPVSVNSFATTLKLLRYFGASMTKISVGYDEITSNQTKVIHEYISNYCLRLKTFEFLNSNENDLHKMRAMPTVESVSFSLQKLDNIGEHFERIFPNMNRLELIFFSTGFLERELEAVLKKNAQIQSLRLTFCPVEFLKVIKDSLHKIESLELVSPLENVSQSLEVVHFDTIKSFSCDDRFSSDDLPFSFDPLNLEELQISSLDLSLGSKWINFIVRHKGLTKLSILHVRLSDSEVMRFAEDLPNLREIEANFGKMTSCDEIVNFVEQSKCLQQIKLISPKKAIVEGLKEKLMNEWDIYVDENSRDGALIVKRR